MIRKYDKLLLYSVQLHVHVVVLSYESMILSKKIFSVENVDTRSSMCTRTAVHVRVQLIIPSAFESIDFVPLYFLRAPR